MSSLTDMPRMKGEESGFEQHQVLLIPCDLCSNKISPVVNVSALNADKQGKQILHCCTNHSVDEF